MTTIRRITYYNPILDPAVVAGFAPATQEQIDDGTYTHGGPLNDPTDDHPANLISSLCDDGMHRPLLDIDIPMVWTPSATPGHGHLSFPTVALTWNQYLDLLHALVAAGIIEHGWVKAAEREEQTVVRMPGVPRIRERQARHPSPFEPTFAPPLGEAF